LRFSNLDVLKETEGVAEAIWDEVSEFAPSRRQSPDATPGRGESPSPGLSPEGSGER